MHLKLVFRDAGGYTHSARAFTYIDTQGRDNIIRILSGKGNFHRNPGNRHCCSRERERSADEHKLHRDYVRINWCLANGQKF